MDMIVTFPGDASGRPVPMLDWSGLSISSTARRDRAPCLLCRSSKSRFVTIVPEQVAGSARPAPQR